MRGLGQDPQKRYVREMIINHRLDFIGLLETTKHFFSKNELHSLSGRKKLVALESSWVEVRWDFSGY